MFSGRYPDTLDAHGVSEWLRVIWAANDVEPGTFGASFLDSGGPSSDTASGDWWAGGYSEEYEHARVIHRGDGSTSIVAKTEHGESVLAQAHHMVTGRAYGE